MTSRIDARVAIGGRIDRFSGIYPGIFEVAWMALVAEKPLFPCGAFGEASDALIQAIVSGRPNRVLLPIQSDECRRCVGLAVTRGVKTIDDGDALNGLPDSQALVIGKKIAADFAAVGQEEISTSLRNGLSRPNHRRSQT